MVELLGAVVSLAAVAVLVLGAVLVIAIATLVWLGAMAMTTGRESYGRATPVPEGTGPDERAWIPRPEAGATGASVAGSGKAPAVGSGRAPALGPGKTPVGGSGNGHVNGRAAGRKVRTVTASVRRA